MFAGIRTVRIIGQRSLSFIQSGGRSGLYLSREATENTVYFHKEFKPPYFYKLTYYDDERYTVTMAKSGSDWRGGDNLFSEIKKRIY